MPPRHSLLRRQLRRHRVEDAAVAGPWTGLLADVDSAYRESDADRGMLERSLDLSSRELLQANAEQRAVLSAIPDLLLRFGPADEIVVIGADADTYPLFAVAPGRGRRLADRPFGEATEAIVETLGALRPGGPARDLRFPLRRDLRAFHYEARFAPLPTGGAIGVFRNITARVQLEERLVQAGKMDAVGQLAGGVAHDFNNILTVILGNLSLLALEPLGGAEARALIADCQAAAKGAAGLTAQLLAFSRREPVRLQPLDLNVVVDGAVRLIRRVIGEQITIHTAAAGATPVLADPRMIEQVLLNLAINARDAMPRGGTLTISTAITASGPGNPPGGENEAPARWARLSVADDGSGIPAEALPHIFEPFYTTKEAGKGTGLGLATVFGIVEQHEGRIEVTSEPGCGTRFDVFFRLHATEPVDAPRLPPAAGAEERRGAETILLVEDDEPVRRWMAALLTRQGYRVHAFPTGAEAWRYFQSTEPQFDLLVADQVMPGGMDGRELARRLRERRPGVKVLRCSGYAETGADAGPPPPAAGAFLPKPFDAATLLRAVRACLDRV